jgi:hypothetical protein
MPAREGTVFIAQLVSGMKVAPEAKAIQTGSRRRILVNNPIVEELKLEIADFERIL